MLVSLFENSQNTKLVQRIFLHLCFLFIYIYVRFFFDLMDPGSKFEQQKLM